MSNYKKLVKELERKTIDVGYLLFVENAIVS